MEAEAQCAELVSLGLVDGVITDDSDVFLFGAQRVYKNMFNQSKTVELFLLSDLERELGLDRDTLIRLAYLLGSDYTEGLSGVGPVLAMELLKEFPGKEGLHKFADWWRRVQEGKDKEGESNTKFRRQLVSPAYDDVGSHSNVVSRKRSSRTFIYLQTGLTPPWSVLSLGGSRFKAYILDSATHIIILQSTVRRSRSNGVCLTLTPFAHFSIKNLDGDKPRSTSFYYPSFRR